MVKKILPVILLLALTLAPLHASAQEGEPESPEAPLSWSRVAVNGFGFTSNDTIWSLAEYKGQLFAGTRNPTMGAQIWFTANGATWTLGPSGGLGDTHNTAFPSMVATYYYLYLGTENAADGAEVWRTDGATWLQINTNGFGNPNNDIAWSMGSDWSNIYVGTLNNANGANVWQYDLANWKALSTNGFGSASNTVATSMTARYRLVAGTWNQATGGQVWSYDPLLVTWNPLNTTGFGVPQNWSARSMLDYNNRLYVGTFNSATGGQIWRYDGISWTRVANNGFGDSHNSGISTMFAYGEYIYAGTENSTSGAEIWRSKDGTSWAQVNADGFGSPNNGEVTALAGFGPYLFAGTRNFVTGGEVWRVNLLGADQSFLINSQSRTERSVNVAFNSHDREYLVSWSNLNPGLYDDDLQAQRLSWDGRLLGSPVSISTGAGVERDCPTAAYDSIRNRYLIVWYAEGSSTFKYMARLFSAVGSPITGEFEIPIADHASTCPQVGYWPEEDEYLVLGTTYNSVTVQAGVFTEIITPGGGVGGAPFWLRQNVPGYMHGNDLAYNAQRGEILLVWSEGNLGSENVYGARMAPTNDLAAVDAPFLISNGVGNRYDDSPSVAALNYPAGNGQYLVAWRHVDLDTHSYSIRVRLISGDGIAQGSPRTATNIITNGYLHPDVISLPLSHRYQLGWREGYYDGYDSVLFTRQIDSAGNILGSPLYAGGSRVSSLGLQTGVGDSYLAAFTDTLVGSAYWQVRGRVFGIKRIYLPLIRH